MQRRLVNSSIILFVVLLLTGSATANSGLKDYKPKSPDEEAIVSLIISYEEAYNSGNIQGCKDLFWEEGKNMYGIERMVFTKAEFDTVLPRQMKDYPVVKFQEPESIEVSGMNATVKIWQKFKDSTGWAPPEGIILYTIECIKKKSQWMFKSIKF